MSIDNTDRLVFQYLKIWSNSLLHTLNTDTMEGKISWQKFCNVVNKDVLSFLPDAEDIPEDFLDLYLLTAGLIGTSCERHSQQAQKVAGVETKDIIIGRGVEALKIRNTPFLLHYNRAAERMDYPPQDNFINLVERNGPEITILHPNTGSPIFSTRGSIDPFYFHSYTGHSSEVVFFKLLKESYALQSAANISLRKLVHGTLPLKHPDAIEEAEKATLYILAVAHRIAVFMKESNFDVDFFLDVFRQFAIQWQPHSPFRVPSGANDSSALEKATCCKNPP